MCNIWWFEDFKCPCDNREDLDCADCKLIERHCLRYGHQGVTQYIKSELMILEGKDGTLHVHTRVNLNEMEAGRFRSALTFKPRAGRDRATSWAWSPDINRFTAVQKNLRMDHWLILTPQMNGSVLWLFPPQVLQEGMELTAFDLQEGLRAKEEVWAAKERVGEWRAKQEYSHGLAVALATAIKAGFEQASTKARSADGELAILQAIDSAIEGKRGLEDFLDSLRATNAGLRAVVTK